MFLTSNPIKIMSLALIKQYTTELVKDFDEQLDPADFDSAIRAAAIKFSQVKPKIRVADKTGINSNTMSLPDDWQTGFSAISQIETPIGEFPPNYLDQSRYTIYEAPFSELLLFDNTIRTDQTLRISYSVPYTLTPTHCDIPESYFDIVSLWAASRLLDQLATLYSGDGDATIGADSVDHNARAREYSYRAKNLRKQFYDDLGIDPKRNIAAGVVVDLNTTPSHGQGRLQHRKNR